MGSGSASRSKGSSNKHRSGKKIVNENKFESEADQNSRSQRLFRSLVIIILGQSGMGSSNIYAYVFDAFLARNHVATMFENDRHFSHLSDLEREMTFRTEMGLYYSYFKAMVKSPSFFDGLKQITQDNVTEYGHTINTLKRFNLYPELILAAMYRAYIKLAKDFNINIQECWRTDRGQGLEPIISCEGMGNQYYFYVNWVFGVSGLVAASVFLYGILISDSIIGGLIAVAAFFFNHGEATRVQWTPPLRESFGYPVFLVQMLVVSFVIKHKVSGSIWSIIIFILTTIFMLFWQFASFALSTQVGSIFVAFAFGYIPPRTVRAISVGLLGAFLLSFVLLFGNEMLLTSLFLSSVVTVQAVLMLNSTLDRISWRLLSPVIKVVLFTVGTLGLKVLIGSVLNIKDDAHVFDILRSKFTNYSDFHTRLYTCATEFDFMQAETVWKLTKSAILPASTLALVFAAILVLKSEWRQTKGAVAHGDKAYGEHEYSGFPLVKLDQRILQWPTIFVISKFLRPRFQLLVYNAVQFGAFAVMAVLIMRLKLFFTPHLCIIAALLASKRVLSEVSGGRLRSIHQQTACVLLIGIMAVEGLKNLQTQWAIKGEYSNAVQEQLFSWIMKNTAKEAVFAGAMPTMANVKLSTERAIVNHPHYEDAGLRQRTMNVYSIFSRKPAEEVHQTLKDMKVNYVIFEFGWCTKGGRPGCALPDLWDLHDEKNRGKTPLCDHFRAGHFLPFVVVFQNDHYKVLKVQ